MSRTPLRQSQPRRNIGGKAKTDLDRKRIIRERMQEKFTPKEYKPYRIVDVVGDPKREVDQVTQDVYVQLCPGLWGKLEHDHGNGSVTARVEVEDIERLIQSLDYEHALIVRAKFDCPAV